MSIVQSNVSGKPQKRHCGRAGQVPSADGYYPVPLTPLIGAQLGARYCTYVTSDYLAGTQIAPLIVLQHEDARKGSAKARFAAHA